MICSVPFTVWQIITIIILSRGTTVISSNGNVQISNRLYGGREAKIGNVPYMVHLAIKQRDGESLCGAAAVSKDHVVSAAHCVYGIRSSSTIIATAGQTDMCNGRGGFVTKVKRVYIHSQYKEVVTGENLESINNDIAVLELADSLPINNNSIDLVDISKIEPIDNEECTLSGWGMTMNEPNIKGSPVRETGGLNKLPCVLRTADISVVRYSPLRNTCELFFSITQFCAGYTGETRFDKNTDANSCQGDSGGPLVCNKELRGVVSYGPSRCSPRIGRPGVFTKVNKFYRWIKDIISNNTWKFRQQLAIIIDLEIDS